MYTQEESKTDEVRKLTGELLDKWDELPNDEKYAPELKDVEAVISKINAAIEELEG